MNRGFFNRCFGLELGLHDLCLDCKHEYECHYIFNNVEEAEELRRIEWEKLYMMETDEHLDLDYFKKQIC